MQTYWKCKPHENIICTIFGGNIRGLEKYYSLGESSDNGIYFSY